MTGLAPSARKSIYLMTGVQLWVAERKRFPKVTAVLYTRYGDADISNSRINTRIQCGDLAHVCDGCKQQHWIQNCGKTAADRDMVTFDNL